MQGKNELKNVLCEVFFNTEKIRGKISFLLNSEENKVDGDFSLVFVFRRFFYFSDQSFLRNPMIHF